MRLIRKPGTFCKFAGVWMFHRLTKRLLRPSTLVACLVLAPPRPFPRFAERAASRSLLHTSAMAAAPAAPATPAAAPSRYPLARRDSAVVEELHGHTVADPYRWLEDPDAKETQEFVAAQNELFRDYIKQAAFRDKVSEGNGQGEGTRNGRGRGRTRRGRGEGEKRARVTRGEEGRERGRAWERTTIGRTREEGSTHALARPAPRGVDQLRCTAAGDSSWVG